MQLLGFTENEMKHVWKILAGILHLGNVTFKAKQVTGGTEATILDTEGTQFIKSPSIQIHGSST